MDAATARVFVVVDDRTIRGFTTLALLAGGFQVKPLTAEDFEQEQLPTLSALVLDYGHALSVAKESPHRGRSVVLVSEAEEADLRSGDSLPFFSLLRIPIDSDVLVKVVKDCCCSQSAIWSADPPAEIGLAEELPIPPEAAAPATSSGGKRIQADRERPQTQKKKPAPKRRR